MTAPDDRFRRSEGDIGDVWLPVNAPTRALPSWSRRAIALVVVAGLAIWVALGSLLI